MNDQPNDLDIIRSLSALLAVEHAAVYAVGTAGGALAPLRSASEAIRVLARNAYTAHRELRDHLVAEIAGRGGAAPVALPAYRLPVAPIELAAVLLVLSDAEDRCAAAAYEALGGLRGELRGLLVDALAGMAVRGQQARIAAGQPLETATRALPGSV